MMKNSTLHHFLLLTLAILCNSRPLAQTPPPAAGASNPSSWKPARTNLIHAQQMVYNLLSTHNELKVVGIHGRAPGADAAGPGTILAINMDRIGKLDDAVDDEVAFKHNLVMEPNPKRNEYEVILPLMDESGRKLDFGINFVFKLDGDSNASAEQHTKFLSKGLALRKEAAAMLPAGTTLFTAVKALNATGGLLMRDEKEAETLTLTNSSQ